MQNIQLGVVILVLKKVNFANKLITTIKDKLSNPNPNVEFMYNSCHTILYFFQNRYFLLKKKPIQTGLLLTNYNEKF